MNTSEQSFIPLSIETRFGIFTAHFSENGLAQLDFPNKSKAIVPDKLSPQIELWRKQTEAALAAALKDGRVKKFPPLDLRGTSFQKRVWEVLRSIPPGETMTYAEVAAEILQPNACRAVGGACGANPIPVLVPCHRVLAATRKIGGFSGGLKWKELLLTIEGHNEFAALAGEMSLFAQQRSVRKAA